MNDHGNTMRLIEYTSKYKVDFCNALCEGLQMGKKGWTLCQTTQIICFRSSRASWRSAKVWISMRSGLVLKLCRARTEKALERERRLDKEEDAKVSVLRSAKKDGIM